MYHNSDSIMMQYPNNDNILSVLDNLKLDNADDIAGRRLAPAYDLTLCTEGYIYLISIIIYTLNGVA